MSVHLFQQSNPLRQFFTSCYLSPSGSSQQGVFQAVILLVDTPAAMEPVIIQVLCVVCMAYPQVYTIEV